MKKEKNRKDCTVWRQLDENSSTIPGCPGLKDGKVLARPVVPDVSSRAYPYMYRPMLAAITGLSLQVCGYNYTAMSSPAVSFLLKQEGSQTHMQGWSRLLKAAAYATYLAHVPSSS